LVPEESVGWDLGVEQSLVEGRVRLGATFFNNDFENLVSFESLVTPPYGLYVNRTEARTWGAETSLAVLPVEGFWVKAGYTYTEATSLDPVTDQSVPLLRRPWHKAVLDLSYHQEKATFGFLMNYVGQRKDTNYPATILMPEHLLLGVTASYRVDDHLELHGRVDNLLDEVYEDIYGYGTSGLAVTAGTRISL
jgi:vitamin B12 transporter